MGNEFLNDADVAMPQAVQLSGKEADVLVSVCINAYNHEDYIADAIQGAVDQKTNFRYEILINDDASTDRTAEVIRGFEKKYPGLVKPFYQPQNQRSKKITERKNTTPMRAVGKYLALCEGDDYWVDTGKLQRQLDAMREHPQCQISFHPALEKWENGTKPDKVICDHGDQTKIINPGEVILGGGGFMPTAATVFHRDCYKKIMEFYKVAPDAPIGDYFRQVISSISGGALYVGGVSAVYRRGAAISWTSQIRIDPAKAMRWAERRLDSTLHLPQFLPVSLHAAAEKAWNQTLRGFLRSPALRPDQKHELYKKYKKNLSLMDDLIAFCLKGKAANSLLDLARYIRKMLLS